MKLVFVPSKTLQPIILKVNWPEKRRETQPPEMFKTADAPHSKRLSISVAGGQLEPPPPQQS